MRLGRWAWAIWGVGLGEPWTEAGADAFRVWWEGSGNGAYCQEGGKRGALRFYSRHPVVVFVAVVWWLRRGVASVSRARRDYLPQLRAKGQ